MPDGLTAGNPERDKLIRALSASLTLLRIVTDDNASVLMCVLGTMVEITLKDIEDDEERDAATVAFVGELCERMGYEVTDG